MATDSKIPIKNSFTAKAYDSENTIDKLQYLSVIKKVTAELDNHIGIDDPVLAEFIVDLSNKSSSEAEFSVSIKNLGADFEPGLISTLHRTISSMLGRTFSGSKNKKVSESFSNSKPYEAVDLTERFPGLAISNSVPISAVDPEDKRRAEQARRRNAAVLSRNRKVELNEIYEGVVTSVKDYGCFVRLSSVADRRCEGLVHVSMEIKRGESVFVKIISLIDSKIGLSMSLVDQKTGRDLSLDDQTRPLSGAEEQIRLREQFESRRGELSPAPARRKRRRVASPERWELSQLRNSGVLSALRESAGQQERVDSGSCDDPFASEDEAASDAEAALDVELNEAEPLFLRHQTARSVRLSPIRVVKNPDGSMARAALAQAELAKERRDLSERFLSNQSGVEAGGSGSAAGLERAWEDPLAAPGERVLAQGIRGAGTRAGSNDATAHNTALGRATTLTLRQQREALPIFKLRAALLAAVAANDVLVVIGATGSGKTTQLTQYLIEAGYGGGGRRVGCTQPRRVAATSVARRVAEERGCRLGGEVGYAIRFEDRTSPATVIKYMTDGMLLREALLDPLLRDYAVVILDEAHERTVQTDVLFGLLKQCVRRRADLKLLVTSATLDAGKFAAYFGDCPVFTIPGRLFPTAIFYAKRAEADYVDAAISTVTQIHLGEPPGDVLLFLTGREEIDSACERLRARMRALGPAAPPLLVLPVYSALPAELQARIFEPAPPGARKCVVATNIAEASLTIDGIYYVVDPGFVKQKVYDARLGLDALVVTPISQAAANQRAGRAGRTGPGQCFRLYTEAAFENEMLPNSVPEIQRANLGAVVLQLKAMGINDLLRFDFMDPPPPRTLVAAMEALYSLGALDDEGLLTRLGRQMAEFPLEPMQSKALIQSAALGCSEELLTVVAMLSAENVWHRPREREAQADTRRARFFEADGDQVTLLTVYRQWERHGCSGAWCAENFVQVRALRRAQDVRRQLAMIMDRYRLDLVSCGRDYSKVRRAIASGFFRHVAKKDPQEGYKTLLEGQQVFVHPSSALFNRQPPWVVYHHLVLTTKEYMREVIPVDPKWLVELAPRSFKRTDAGKISRQKQREKIEPLFRPNSTDPDAWRLSRR